jgi:hypothetical protein
MTFKAVDICHDLNPFLHESCHVIPWSLLFCFVQRCATGMPFLLTGLDKCGGWGPINYGSDFSHHVHIG